MQKKLVRHGNSYALVIDKAILRLMGIKPGNYVELTLEGGALMIKPIKRVIRKKRQISKAKRKRLIDQAADRIISGTYSGALRHIED